MQRFLKMLVVGAVLLGTGVALAANAPPVSNPSSVKVKKTHSIQKAKTAKRAKSSTVGQAQSAVPQVQPAVPAKKIY